MVAVMPVRMDMPMPIAPAQRRRHGRHQDQRRHAVPAVAVLVLEAVRQPLVAACRLAPAAEADAAVGGGAAAAAVVAGVGGGGVAAAHALALQARKVPEAAAFTHMLVQMRQYEEEEEARDEPNKANTPTLTHNDTQHNTTPHQSQ